MTANVEEQPKHLITLEVLVYLCFLVEQRLMHYLWKIPDLESHLLTNICTNLFSMFYGLRTANH